MFFNSYDDSAGLPPMNSPSLLSFYPSYEINNPEVYASLSPNVNKLFDFSTPTFPFDLPLPEGHEFTRYPFMNPDPNLNEYQELGYTGMTLSNQIDTQDLFSTPPAYGQLLSTSPRLSNSSIEFVPAFSQNSSPNFSATDITSSFLFPQTHGQLAQVGNEYFHLEPDSSVPLLNLQTPHSSFFSNINADVPVLPSQQVWRSAPPATTTPVPKSKRTASSSKKVLSATSSQSNPYPVIPSSNSKSVHPPRAKRATRSSHVILTDSPVSITQGGYARKYACTWEGCGKAFTTSGHLVRHKRIHTGEKRYECAMENCSSRFSRQDNMLQHYRTHFSSKSRRIPSPSFVKPNQPPPQAPDLLTNTTNPTLVVPQLSKSFGQLFAGK
ncbi:hypothetical protein PCASD_26667 [Puccinia coronata f. sp. avenae]|uniref:C2H2-type domain-containing protein n=1 Tax=Puccinia coronata f. sp. avenae TaxID=200324 RepID=A0A2N5RXQ7_9BASI|nr:hypothetical protein PCASD_26667 [Puccinia coronata f. sp. avenae]